MADIKFSEFPKANQSKDSDEIAILQDGVNKMIPSPVLESKIINKTVSRVIDQGGASLNLINPIGVVPTYADLALITPTPELNDAYQVEADGLVYVYTESGFQADGDGFIVQPEPNGVIEEGNPQAVSGGEVWKIANQEISGDVIDITPYIINDRRINSTGTLITVDGSKVAYRVPFNGNSLLIKGFNDSDTLSTRSFIWLDVNFIALDFFQISNDTGMLTPPPDAEYFCFNIIHDSSQQTDPTNLTVEKNIKIVKIGGNSLSADYLNNDNYVPQANSNYNATNLLDLKTKTFNKENSEVTGNNNLALKSEIKDRGYYIGVTGTKTSGTGWYTFLYKAKQGEKFTFNGLVSGNVLYLSFFNDSDVYVSGSVIKFNDGIIDQPVTITFPVDGYVVIDCARPTDTVPDAFDNFMFNEGSVSLPYEEPIERTISKIGGYKIVADSEISLKEPTRLAHFNFWIDDGGSTDTTLKTIFDNKNVKAGWALITNYQGNPLTQTQIDRYLAYQNEGHTIGSHSVTHQSFQTTITPTVAEEEMRNSKKTLLSLGFEIDFWITPQSQMRTDLIPLLRKYYKYGFTQYFGVPTPSNLNGYDTYFTENRLLKRVSMEGSSTIDDLKLQVDEAISKGALVTFYGHTPTAIGTTKLNELLDYINVKAENLECVVDSPKKIMESYFAYSNEIFT